MKKQQAARPGRIITIIHNPYRKHVPFTRVVVRYGRKSWARFATANSASPTRLEQPKADKGSFPHDLSRHKDTRSELEQALSTQNRYLKQLLDIEKERSLVETEIAEVQENIDRRKALIHDFTSATESDSKRPDKEPSEPTDNLTIMSDEALDTVVFSRQSPEEPYQQPGVGTTSFSPPSTVQTADSRNPISRILSNSSTKNKTNEERLRRANLDISTLPAEIDLAYENWQKRALVLSELKHLHRRVEVRYQETVSDVIWEATRDSQA
ncbi:hypothetical protein I350_05033 [Cryptococcus amylolentus CBS 6273]|uniref:Uncharacterized protein n=1 Tax=Cryptococcus amylolentus CBS 6273 TaxID=1296118 RepID=A0A1E3K1A2_9TREE|nr:hypothetical protein I350_05033 [Cryptococcus amylolentus CBS 6273]